MQKRRFILGDYNTAYFGWTLTGWKLEAAEQKTTFVDKPNGDGSWDLSTTLTDGVPKYKDRKLTITLEASEGSRMEREAIIREMVNTLHGARVNITLPDDDDHYMVGRLHVAREYNDLAHAAVTVTAICEPWKYSTIQTVIVLQASDSWQSAMLTNAGGRVVSPWITVSGSNASVVMWFNNMQLSIGPHKGFYWADLIVKPGSHEFMYQGSGTITLTYREAVLE